MEANERPAKLRKLSHGKQELLDQLPDLYQGPPPTTTTPSNDNTAKPFSESTTNIRPRSESPDRETDSDENDSVTLQNTEAVDLSQLSPTLSKNQQKKLRKRQEWEAGKAYRKAKRKEKEKEKRERKREERGLRIANGEPVQQPEKPKIQHHVRLPVTFLIDCGFDDKMMEKEMISLGSQVTRAYSENSRAPFQAHLVVSSWGGLLKDRFDTVLSGQYRNWKGTKFEESDFVQAAEEAKLAMAGRGGGKMAGVFKKYANVRKTNGVSKEQQQQLKDENKHIETRTITATAPLAVLGDNGQPDVRHQDGDEEPRVVTASTTESTETPQSQPNPLPEPEIVYLTSDSPNTLTQLSPYSTYIIGGIVDKNRHKGLCYQIARDRGVKTAKLPIGEFMEMQSRFVLATNHVVEIMVRWLECGDWGEAFMKVIPKRKGGKLKGGGLDGKEEEEEGKEEADGGADDVAEEEDRVSNDARDGQGAVGELDSIATTASL